MLVITVIRAGKNDFPFFICIFAAKESGECEANGQLWLEIKDGEFDFWCVMLIANFPSNWKKSIGKTMGVEHFKVELHRTQSGAYSSGDVIRGYVVLINRTQIEFFGKQF